MHLDPSSNLRKSNNTNSTTGSESMTFGLKVEAAPNSQSPLHYRLRDGDGYLRIPQVQGES